MLRAFYERLLRAVAGSGLRSGDWQLCECSGWPDNDSHRQLLSWCWSAGDDAPPRGRELRRRSRAGRVHLPWQDMAGREWKLTDLLDGSGFEREGDELAGEGLYVALDPWASHFLSFAA